MSHPDVDQFTVVDQPTSAGWEVGERLAPRRWRIEPRPSLSQKVVTWAVSVARERKMVCTVAERDSSH